jgi:hypothetical protein
MVKTSGENLECESCGKCWVSGRLDDEMGMGWDSPRMCRSEEWKDLENPASVAAGMWLVETHLNLITQHNNMAVWPPGLVVKQELRQSLF